VQIGTRGPLRELLAALLLTLVGAVGWGQTNAYERAAMLLSRGVVFEAIHDLEIFVAANPDDTGARMLLARTLLRVKRGRRAAEEAIQVLRINPHHEEAQRMLTQTRIALGRELDRDDPVAVLDYARLCARPGSYERAETYYKRYFELDDTPGVRVEFARMLSWAGRYEESARQFRAYLSFAPEDIDARWTLGRVYNSMARFQDAVVEFTYCSDRRPEDLEIKLDLARALSWSGREVEARALLEDLRRQAPNYDVPLVLLAALARMRGRQQEEYNLLRRVLEINPDDAKTQARLAELESGANLKIAGLQAKLESAPDDLVTRWKLVALYEQEDQLGAAIRELDQITVRAPFESEARARLQALRAAEGARVLAQLAGFKTAFEEERRRKIERGSAWLAANPDDALTRFALSDMLLAEGRDEDAIAHLELLRGGADTDARVLERLGRARMRLEQKKTEARKTLSKKQRPDY
jgi:thioredoxin-like negative regulator of GroEL